MNFCLRLYTGHNHLKLVSTFFPSRTQGHSYQQPCRLAMAFPQDSLFQQVIHGTIKLPQGLYPAMAQWRTTLLRTTVEVVHFNCEESQIQQFLNGQMVLLVAKVTANGSCLQLSQLCSYSAFSIVNKSQFLDGYFLLK